MAVEQEALKQRLSEWARWTGAWRPKLGCPARVPFIALMKPTFVHDGEGSDERIDEWAMQVIDASIESLPALLADAIYCRYLRDEDHEMADKAEIELTVIVLRKGLLLL